MTHEDRVIASIPIAEAVAWRFWRRLPHYLDRRDLVQDGMLGILAAERTFDPTRGKKFSSYAWTRASLAIIESLRAATVRVKHQAGTRRRMSLAQRHAMLTALIHGRAHRDLPEWIAPSPTMPEPQYMEALSAAKVRAVLRQLPARDRQVLVAYYFQGQTTTQIAQAMHTTQSTASKWHQKAMARLRATLQKPHVEAA